MLLEKLLRQSKEARRLAARIMETRNKSKEIRKNRILREEQYASPRVVALFLSFSGLLRNSKILLENLPLHHPFSLLVGPEY